MCGIAGFINKENSQPVERLGDLVERMTSSLRHRGPDDAGTWVDEQAGIALGHRRLSIIDLSPAGHQPMHSICGRYVIVFNGEIYNYLDIRNDLIGRGHGFRGTSDTEVMLTAFLAYGFEEAVRKFNGMFAFALWDRWERILRLARDRLGEKPLYYGWSGGTFLFASELKALRQHPAFVPILNRDAVALYTRHNYVPAPYCVYSGIQKLPPGASLTVRSPLALGGATPVPYWSACRVAERGVESPFRGRDVDAIDELERVLAKAVKSRMVADVPLGAFLSGGIDSSTIVALMQGQSSISVKTFSIGFAEDEYDEAKHARTVAKHLGTAHTEMYVTSREAMGVIPQLPQIFDEPFGDSSQIPTCVVSKLARAHVTVSLSGDAGDELFGGYHRYSQAREFARILSRVPGPVRILASNALRRLTSRTDDALVQQVARFMPSRLSARRNLDRVRDLAERIRDPETLYRNLVSHCKRPSALVLGATEPPTVLTDRSHWATLPDFTLRMMYFDMVSYLPDDILVKVDRASMAVSLESRVPMLDHELVEFAWRLPLDMKVRNGEGKWILRQVLYRHVPKHLVDRPKKGFGVPIGDWIRGDLRSWAEELLAEPRLRRDGIFHVRPIRAMWEEHLSGKANWQYALWDILMFQAWLQAQA